MICRLFVTILLVSHLGLALHHEIHERKTEAQAATDEVYQNGLIDLKNQLIKSMGDLQGEVEKVTVALKASGSSAHADLAPAHSRLLQERTALDKVGDYIKVPLNPHPCNTTAQAIKNRDALREKSNQVNSSVQALKKGLADCSNFTVTTDLNLLILQQENYCKVINEICDSNCTKALKPLEAQKPSSLVDLSHSQYKQNLMAKNWVFGNITEDQYKYQVFEASIKNNLTGCPINKPYVNPKSNNCFDCPNGLTFNLGKKTCEPCPDNFTFDLSTQQCNSPCQNNQLYNTSTKKCDPKPVNQTDSVCPLVKPIWDATSKSCVTCPVATPVFDKTDKKCVSCPNNTTWVEVEKKCIKSCPQGEEYEPSTDKCVSKSQCANGQVWNTTNHACETQCKVGYRVNPRTNACEVAEPKKCDEIKPIWNKTSLQCEICPQSTPVWNETDSKCNPCPPKLPVYDYSLFKCIEKICDAGLKWNQEKLKCSPEAGNCAKNQAYQFENESCIQKCEANHTYIKENDTCECFPERPVFNKTSRKCEDPLCNTTGEKWNENLKKCVPEKGNCSLSQEYNFTAAKCVDKCEAGVTYVEANDSCKCPPQMPTFNKTNRKCEEGICTKADEKWNVALKKCSLVSKNCSEWQVYNFTTEDCLSKCEVNHTYMKDKDTCQCTAEYPLFDTATRTCVKPICPTGHAWNKVLIKCSFMNQTCQTWEEYDFKTEHCVQKCEVNQTYFEKNDKCTCPPDRPAYNQTAKKCEQPVCPAGYKYSLLMICCLPLTKDCDSWQFYNGTTGVCMVKCEVNQTYFKDKLTCSCPAERPFYNTASSSCTGPPCPTGTAWNKLLKNCTLINKQCEAWQLYEFDSGKCLDKCPVNHTYFKASNSCSCDPETPEYDHHSKKCVEPICPTGLLWNKILIKCSEVKKECKVWQTYDFTTEICQTKCEENITYDRRRDLCLCPAERPFFNAERKCIEPNCSQGYKYNKNLIKCSSVSGNCSVWQFYNCTDETCLTRCPVNHTYIKETDACTCTPQLPVFNNKTRTCVEPVCPTDHKWNRHMIKCSLTDLKCKKWQQYNFTVESCYDVCEPDHTYFPANSTCECFPEAPHFDNTTMKCVIPGCPQHYFWNTQLKKCSSRNGTCPIWKLYNATTEKCDVKCKVNQQYHPSTSTCQCTPEYPLFDHNTDQCIEPPCPTGYKYNKLKIKCSILVPAVACDKWELYDFLTEECIARCEVNHIYYSKNDTCQCYPADPIFNRETRKCEEPVCRYGKGWDRVKYRCRCNEGYEYNFGTLNCENNQVTCPPGFFYNSKTNLCVSCSAGFIYNNTLNECVAQISNICPQNYTFNPTTRFCDPPFDPNTNCPTGFNYNKLKTKCSILVPAVACDKWELYDFLTEECIARCEVNHIYYSKNDTCQCYPADPIFNRETRKCEEPVCRYGKGWDRVKYRCRRNEGQEYKKTTKQLDKSIRPAGYSFKCKNNQVTCPPSFFYNSKTNQCVSCPAGFIYNNTLNVCVAQISNICPQNYTYNPTTRFCDPPFVPNTNCPTGFKYNNATQLCQLSYITSPQASNLITKNMNAYKEFYNSQKQSNSGLTDCAVPTLYYDKTGYKCISCPADHPYFNLDVNKCESCGTLRYDSTTYKCLKPSLFNKHKYIDPTIGRFISNVF